MAFRRSRRPGLPPLWRRAVSATALLLVLALPVAAGLVELSPLSGTGRLAARPPVNVTMPAVAQQMPDAGGLTPDDITPPNDLPAPAAEPAVAVAKPSSGLSVPILTYHWIRINPVPADQLGFHLSVTPDNFAQQMEFLHYAGAHPITLAEAMGALQTGKPLPSRPVILTFDDGYGDFATHATPVLKRLGFVGTDYVVSGFIGHTAYMNADQIHEVEQAGMVIGCHTVNHLDLARIPAQVAQMQIKVSHQQLEQLLGHPVLDFAYPYGGFNGQVEQMVLADGFREAVTTQGGTWLQIGSRAAWPRLHVDGADSLAAFAYKALTGTPGGAVQQLLHNFATQQAPQTQPSPSPSPTHRVAFIDQPSGGRRST
ncbi:MAG TPA: polysaccharide deacetylase family protein [Candidatus Angelobacter sp.]|jgi:peptidoglycan/xylan/chitin deacetylase (PgdA/CDA1 family)|nr:polysaccharide deacetylase family protein [Candidatus Angelobacter sp.]